MFISIKTDALFYITITPFSFKLSSNNNNNNSRTILFITILYLLSLSSSQQSPDLTQEDGLLLGVKSRLGSSPPSCHNKCNQCHPCMAVQVPTPLSHLRVQPGPTPQLVTTSHPLSPGNNYSNYKPLSWKCRCNNHLYNP